MNRPHSICWLKLICLLTGCKSGATGPPVDGIASPESVAQSLATVASEESLYLFNYDCQATPGYPGGTTLA